MHIHYLRSGSWARLSLLVAALLYLGGAVVEPLVHRHDALADGVESVWEEGLEDDASESETSTPHTGPECFLCKAFGAVALPELTVVVLGFHSEADHLFLLPQPWHSPAAHAVPQPRGPPFA